jgi:hypothetical protein
VTGNRLAVLLAALALLSASGCATVNTSPRGFITWQVLEEDTPAEVRLGDLPVRTGQIVASEQASAQSVFMTLMLAESYRYIHTGIVVVEDGEAWVYESVGQFNPPVLASAPPTRFVGGGVRRVSLADYLWRQRLVTLFDPPPGTDPEALARFARDSLAKRLPFDPWFDREDPSRVYCTEYTALGLEAAGAAPRSALPLNPNRSLAVVREWLGVTAAEIIPGEAIVADGKPVARVSRYFTPAQIEAYFAAKAELHRRFTGDQKLGNVLRLSPFRGLQFQPPVRNFLTAVREAARDWEQLSAAGIREAVDRMARTHLGPPPES